VNDRIHNIASACQSIVIPAQAGIQHLHRDSWIPACAGMTMLFDDALPRIIACGSPQP